MVRPMNRTKTKLQIKRSHRPGGRISCTLILLATLAAPAAPKPGGKVDFTRDIRPILSDNCFACHGPDTNKLKATFRPDWKPKPSKNSTPAASASVLGSPS